MPLGIDVSFFIGENNQGTKLGTKPTTQALLTGGSTVVKWTVAPPELKPGPQSYYVEVDGVGR